MTQTMIRETRESAPRTSADYAALAAELVPLLRREANAIEAARELTPPVVAALVERDFFRLLLDPARGTGTFGMEDAYRVVATLASGDPSTAWDVMAAMGGSIVSAFLPEGSTERIYASPRDAVASAVGRMGKATAVEGGYLVEARWPFLSGSPHATWIGGLCIVHDGDAPRMSPEGEPHVVMPLIRKERVNLLDSWHATGLRGTGSHDAEVAGLFVPEAEKVDFASGPRPGLPPIYSIDENAAAPLIAAGVAIGLAQGAALSYRELMAKRTHQSGVPASEAPLPQLALARAEAGIAGADASLLALARELDSMLARGELPGTGMVRRVSLAATSAMETVIAAVSDLYRAAGTAAVFTGSPLERALRDAYTLGAHRMLQRENYLVHGPALFV